MYDRVLRTYFTITIDSQNSFLPLPVMIIITVAA